MYNIGTNKSNNLIIIKALPSNELSINRAIVVISFPNVFIYNNTILIKFTWHNEYQI